MRRVQIKLIRSPTRKFYYGQKRFWTASNKCFCLIYLMACNQHIDSNHACVPWNRHRFFVLSSEAITTVWVTQCWHSLDGDERRETLVGSDDVSYTVQLTAKSRNNSAFSNISTSLTPKKYKFWKKNGFISCKNIVNSLANKTISSP